MSGRRKEAPVPDGGTAATPEASARAAAEAPARATDGGPWYAEGLRFRCTACGQCCTGEPGHVWATKDEMKAMAKARGVSLHVFKQRFVRRVGKRFSLKTVLMLGDRC